MPAVSGNTISSFSAEQKSWEEQPVSLGAGQLSVSAIEGYDPRMAFALQPWQILGGAPVGWITRQPDAAIEFLREENRVPEVTTRSQTTPADRHSTQAICGPRQGHRSAGPR